MQTKIYLGDWFFNCGIVGFLRILEHNNDNFAQIKDSYITFDTQSLKNFHKYYFNYFFDKYNVANRTKDKINQSFEKIASALKTESTDKAEIKRIQERVKTEKNYIKSVIKTQLDKIKKIDENVYQTIFEQYNEIDAVKEKEDIEKLTKIRQVIISKIEKDDINKRLTMNLFKSILSNKYFGQPSFLNVVNTKLSYEEQEKLMYKDYISNIIETDFLDEILENNYTLEQIEKNISDKLSNGLLTKEVIQVYTNIQKKFIEKDKNIEEIKKYISEKVLNYCYMCENEKTLTTNYSEGNFIPLAVSSDNMKNFFWNQNAKFPICDTCKLILFCIPAGISSVSKTVQENVNGQVTYREKEIFGFVNNDVSVEELLQYNNNLTQSSKMDKTIHNPYSDLILSIVEQKKDISEWQLQNIFVVEFESEYLAFSRVEYFNIKRYVAKFFVNYSKIFTAINDYRYKLQIIDYILKNKDIKYVINQRLREEFEKDVPNGFNNYLATKVRLILNLLKKEDSNMNETIKKNNNKLYVLYSLGVAIHEELKAKNEENKLDGYVYKMLNSIKSGNKKEFMDIVIRIHMSMGKDVSPIFLEVMQNSDLDFESIGHSFVSGLISNKLEKNNEEVVSNENN